MIYQSPEMLIVSFSEENIRCDLTIVTSGPGTGGTIPDDINETPTEPLGI